MAISKGRVDGGQGGKLGHSNMNHWDYTEAIKAASRKWRRLTAKSEIAEGLTEHETETDFEVSTHDLSDELP
ncbi:MAG: hypothetical protein H7Z16_01210 [Pyrinomonadaceae bacterium]|nr:hypothetical protein [Pyrinomonadaceae bacterium]